MTLYTHVTYEWLLGWSISTVHADRIYQSNLTHLLIKIGDNSANSLHPGLKQHIKMCWTLCMNPISFYILARMRHPSFGPHMNVQHDDEFIERHNGELDVLLIFVCATPLASMWMQLKCIVQAGLFLAVSSAFIVNMQSSLSPNASDALLKILVNTIDNNTFPAQEAILRAQWKLTMSWSGAGGFFL